ncbi:MAG: hypothetical protein ACLQBD_00815 [Syntrophobacteraceae bacterium]
MAEPAERKMSYNEILEEALKAREQFLKEHPHLQAFQDEIDRIMEKTVGFENRMSVLAFMIEAKLYELRDSISRLRPAPPLKVERLFDKAKVENADESLVCSANSGCYLN